MRQFRHVSLAMYLVSVMSVWGMGTNGSTTLSVALHAGEINYNLSQADTAFELATDLGVGGVRIDLFWHDIQPTPSYWDISKLCFYANFFERAAERGVELTVILSSPPDWAKSLFTAGNRDGFFAAWAAYAAKVVETVGAAVRTVVAWQLWNEMNHVPR